jgi:hypothetical protein
MCFAWILGRTAIISLYCINWLLFITETKCVYCAVRAGSLYIIHVHLSLYNVSAIFTIIRLLLCFWYNLIYGEWIPTFKICYSHTIQPVTVFNVSPFRFTCFDNWKRPRNFRLIRKIAKSDLVSSRLSVCSSIRSRGTTRLILEVFWLSLIFEYFSKILRKNQVH